MSSDTDPKFLNIAKTWLAIHQARIEGRHVDAARHAREWYNQVGVRYIPRRERVEGRHSDEVLAEQVLKYTSRWIIRRLNILNTRCKEFFTK